MPWQNKHLRLPGAWSWGSLESIHICRNVEVEVNGHRKFLKYKSLLILPHVIYRNVHTHTYKRPILFHTFNLFTTFKNLLGTSQVFAEPGRSSLLIWVTTSDSLLTASFYAYAGDHAQQLLLHNLFLCQATYRSVFMRDLHPRNTRMSSWGWALRNNLAASSSQCSVRTAPCGNFSQASVCKKKGENKLHVQNGVCHLTNTQREPSAWNRI